VLGASPSGTHTNGNLKAGIMRQIENPERYVKARLLLSCQSSSTRQGARARGSSSPMGLFDPRANSQGVTWGARDGTNATLSARRRATADRVCGWAARLGTIAKARAGELRDLGGCRRAQSAARRRMPSPPRCQSQALELASQRTAYRHHGFDVLSLLSDSTAGPNSLQDGPLQAPHLLTTWLVEAEAGK
jgi:hypothetical protein